MLDWAVQFEWDAKKATANWKKHRVSFDEASTVFGDPLAVTIDDPDRSNDENRLVTTGLSANRKLLVVAHAYNEGTIRIISARHATKKEVKQYESKD